MWFDARMQVRRSSLRGADRPDCPCAGKVREGLKKVHSHDSYERYRDVDGDEKVRIPVFRCVLCGQYLSVLPDEMLPYRAIGVEKVEAHFDTTYEHEEAAEGPTCTQKEQGCLERAAKRFAQRTQALSNLLGQMITVIGPSARELWCELRRFGRLKKILRTLSETFKTSLLGDYRCLSASKAPAVQAGAR